MFRLSSLLPPSPLVANPAEPTSSTPPCPRGGDRQPLPVGLLRPGVRPAELPDPCPSTSPPANFVGAPSSTAYSSPGAEARHGEGTLHSGWSSTSPTSFSTPTSVESFVGGFGPGPGLDSVSRRDLLQFLGGGRVPTRTPSCLRIQGTTIRASFFKSAAEHPRGLSIDRLVPAPPRSVAASRGDDVGLTRPSEIVNSSQPRPTSAPCRRWAAGFGRLPPWPATLHRPSPGSRPPRSPTTAILAPDAAARPPSASIPPTASPCRGRAAVDRRLSRDGRRSMRCRSGGSARAQARRTRSCGPPSGSSEPLGELVTLEMGKTARVAQIQECVDIAIRGRLSRHLHGLTGGVRAVYEQGIRWAPSASSPFNSRPRSGRNWLPAAVCGDAMIWAS